MKVFRRRGVDGMFAIRGEGGYREVMMLTVFEIVRPPSLALPLNVSVLVSEGGWFLVEMI